MHEHSTDARYGMRNDVAPRIRGRLNIVRCSSSSAPNLESVLGVK